MSRLTFIVCGLVLFATPASAQSTTEDGVRAMLRGDYRTAFRILQPLADNTAHPDLASCERRASVALIRSLVEFDARRLYLREGCLSLFSYCTHVLHLSEGSAYNRIETARAAGRFPSVLEALEGGDVTLTRRTEERAAPHRRRVIRADPR